jgi:hypothetical protein
MEEHILREELERLRGQPDALIAIIIEQHKRIGLLEQEIKRLTERVRELENQNHPPAAPFRRKRKDTGAAPGKPGRKPGHKADWKQKPGEIDEHIEVRLAPHCPCCESLLQECQPRDQYIEEIIPARKHVTHLRTWQGYCPKCDQVVQSTHPGQVSEASGAAGTHLGVRALGVACMLKHQMGLSFSKTSEALKELGGITTSPGGLAQVYQRVAGKLRG